MVGSKLTQTKPMEERNMKASAQYPDTTYVQGQEVSELRDKFYAECVSHARGNVLAKIDMTPHNLFEWFRPYLKTPDQFVEPKKQNGKPVRGLEESVGSWTKRLEAYVDSLPDNKMVSDEETIFNEARLTHPMTGFKHKDFQEFQSWKQKQDGWPDNIENKAK